jgi:hypothetical protein
MFTRLLEQLALSLDQARIPYMIIGGQAVLLYGEPRLTKDITLTVGVDLDRLPDLEAVASALSLKPLVDPKTFTGQTMVLPCEDPESGIRVDFILSHSPSERGALERVRTVTMGQAQVRFASLEDLIIHKMVAGRPRDLEDIVSLVRKNHRMDHSYLERWLEQFSTTLHEPFVDRWKKLLEETE